MNAHVTSAGGGGGGGGKTKNTVYVAGLAPEVNEQQLLDAFVTFGTSPTRLFTRESEGISGVGARSRAGRRRVLRGAYRMALHAAPKVAPQ
jgi:hypothetical protein